VATTLRTARRNYRRKSLDSHLGTKLYQIHCPRFSKGEETALYEIMHSDDKEAAQAAREKLILSVLPWTLTCANRYILETTETHEREDILSEAMLGTLEAVSRFDPQKGRLSTITWWYVKKQVMIWFRSNAKRRSRTTHYSDLPIKTHDGVPQGTEDLALSPNKPPEDCADESIKMEMIEKVVPLLCPRKWHALNMRCDGNTLKATGDTLGVSKERIRQMTGEIASEIRARMKGWQSWHEIWTEGKERAAQATAQVTAQATAQVTAQSATQTGTKTIEQEKRGVA